MPNRTGPSMGSLLAKDLREYDKMEHPRGSEFGLVTVHSATLCSHGTPVIRIEFTADNKIEDEVAFADPDAVFRIEHTTCKHGCGRVIDGDTLYCGMCDET